MNQINRKQFSNIAIATLLFFSGACALGYQSIWLREFRLVFGATTAATGAVLAIFMGGLGLGNAWFGKRADHWSNPFRCYALLELGILLTAAISPLMIDVISSVNLLLGGQTEMGKFTATLSRLIGSTAVLIIPTFLMGGTLPCCAKIITADGDLQRRGVGLIYGFNTLGAMAGVLAANFLLLEALGNRGLLWTCCIINLIVVILAFRVSLSRSAIITPAPDANSLAASIPKIPGPIAANTPAFSSLWCGRAMCKLARFNLLLFAAGIGFVFFVMELVWYRMLGPLLGGTTYTFALILATVLAGIGIGGSVYGSVAPRLGNLRRWLSMTCAAEALALGIPFWMGDSLALWVLQLAMESSVDFPSQVYRWSLVTTVVVFPTSLIAGFQFPLLIAAAGSGGTSVGRDVGWLFSANTLGAITGSLCGGFFILPWLTAPGTWRISILLLSVTSILMLIQDWSSEKKSLWSTLARTTIITTSVLGLMTFVSRGPTAFWRHSGIGAKRAVLFGDSPNSVQALLNRQRRIPILETEGIETSIAITAIDSLTFVVNGKSDGNAFGDCRTQIGSTILGSLIHKAPTSGLVIGLGTGESAGWLAGVDFMHRVDVVELEPKITRMAELCSSMNEDVLRNPKVHLSFNDARESLLTSNCTYDLIFSEPSNPYRAGVANLYTTEFYTCVRNRLNPDGLFLQWLQGYEVDARTIHIALHTLRNTFSTIQVWITQSRDILFVCGAPNAFDNFGERQLEERLRVPTISRGLRSSWLTADVAGVLAHYVCGTPTIDSILNANPAPLNSDNRNYLEFAFAKSLGTFIEFSIEDLRRKALEFNDHLPFAIQDSTAEKVRRRTIASYAVLGSYVPTIPGLTDDDQLLSDGINFYLGGNYEEAALRLTISNVDDNCPIERVTAAHAYSVTNREIPKEWLNRIYDFRRCEALAIQSTVYCKQGSWQACLETLKLFFEEMQKDPWGTSQVLRQAYQNAITIAKVNPIFATEIAKILSQRWAVYRDEEMRQILRYRVAVYGSDEDLLTAIESYEPYPLWIEEFLERRAELYQRSNHELRGRATKDIARYRLQYEIGDR